MYVCIYNKVYLHLVFQPSNLFQYIVDKLKSLGYDVEVHHFKDSTPAGTKDFYNVIARQDKRARRYLTLVCHYDSKDCRLLACLLPLPMNFFVECLVVGFFI